MVLAVFRLDHRPIRDKRISTHLALTARAFGAVEFYYSGSHDSHLESSIAQVLLDWGGYLTYSHIPDPLPFFRSWKRERGLLIHLTMYGIELSDRLSLLQKATNSHDLLIIVGGSKVPGVIFDIADYNIAIGHQPHSEVAALAVFLDRLTNGLARLHRFPNAHIEIIPSEHGKKTRVISEDSYSTNSYNPLKK